jgi:hypothetical protein
LVGLPGFAIDATANIGNWLFQGMSAVAQNRSPGPYEWQDFNPLPTYEETYNPPAPVGPQEEGALLAGQVTSPDPTGPLGKLAKGVGFAAGALRGLDLVEDVATAGRRAGRAGRRTGRSSGLLGDIDPRMGTEAERAAWHGTPHKFASLPDAPHGKIDLSRVGTGEGHQAYGWGFYAAEQPGTARVYAEQIKDMTKIDAMNTRLARISKAMEPHRAAEYGKFRTDEGRRLYDEYNTLMAEKLRLVDEPGNIYELDIPDESIDKMLDWDKPLSEQPKEIRETIYEVYGSRDIDDMTGGEVYDDIAWDMAGGPEGEDFHRLASLKLNEMGIPGIKYRDMGSRGSGEGTRNFVLFDENTAKVVGVE